MQCSWIILSKRKMTAIKRSHDIKEPFRFSNGTESLLRVLILKILPYLYILVFSMPFPNRLPRWHLLVK